MRTSWAGLLLLAVGLVGLLGAAPPAPVRTAQRVQLSPEPPLADAPPPVAVPGPPPVGSPCPLDPPPPMVAIRVRVAACAAPGQELVYRINVVNRSPAAAHHVTVRNPLPANAAFVRAVPEPALREPELAWHLGTLPPCGCREIVLVLRPTGNGDVRNCARVQIEHGQCVTTRVVGPAAVVPPPVPVTSPLVVLKTGPARATLFHAIPYRIEVVNKGPAPLANVVLTDLLPGGLEYVAADGKQSSPPPRQEAKHPRTLLTWELGTVEPGKPRVFEYSALSRTEGSFTNLAVVTAAGGLRQESASRVVVGTARVEVKMTGPDHRYLDHPADYELTVSNAGSAPASNVTVSNPIPAGAKFASASDGGSQQPGGEVQWLLGTLAAGARKTLHLRLTADKKGEVINRATATADGGLSATAEVKTLFEGVAGLTATIDQKPAIAQRGEQVRYKITVQNTGTADVTELKVTAIVPPELRLNDARPATGKYAGNTVTFPPLTLQPGKTMSYEVFATVLMGKEARFRLRIEAKELTAGPLTKEASTPIE